LGPIKPWLANHEEKNGRKLDVTCGGNIMQRQLVFNMKKSTRGGAGGGRSWTFAQRSYFEGTRGGGRGQNPKKRLSSPAVIKVVWAGASNSKFYQIKHERGKLGGRGREVSEMGNFWKNIRKAEDP